MKVSEKESLISSASSQRNWGISMSVQTISAIQSECIARQHNANEQSDQNQPEKDTDLHDDCVT
jgi:hypothetical protein